ncbi:prepilin-type N-terminal cleavage/methylation domain-containing protein [Vibrio pelagius]|uniref:Prepilin-type N-terminal cleavage/methylation domain-containing protein n=1 Tax=Vibrio pelagius TaxID=28169 RepID=A0ABY5GA05_VIBPE|nr:prepilin-type N-terminal cleavage/methylation domain-containing protein [Vibrio pelagius]UTT86896.1 prepilin-type N-terminal cleavage/methylation domain-containing protein [Vibrio pelagius]
MSKGFTLIELIVIIVLIVVLSAVSAPRFLNVTTDARNAVLSGIKGDIESQIAIVYGKLAVVGLEGENEDNDALLTGGGYFGDEPDYNPFKDICGHDCYFIYGTPSASATTLSSLLPSVGQDQEIVFSGYHANEWQSDGVTGTNVVGTFSFKDNVILNGEPALNKLKKESCFIWYSGARKERDYKIGIVPCD